MKSSFSKITTKGTNTTTFSFPVRNKALMGFIQACFTCALLALAGLALSACQVKTEAVEVRDPVREAEAMRVAMAAQDEAAQRAIERDILQAQADKARAEAEAARQAVPAAVLRNSLIYLGLGVSMLVLAVGSAFAVVAWLNKRAATVYPNSAGMYPVIVKRAWNGVTWVHDPNRALGPSAIYTTPSLTDVILGWAQRVGGQSGETTQVGAYFPAAASEHTMLQLSTQAQAVGLVAAATRHKPTGHNTHQATQLAQAVMGQSGLSAPLPPVRTSAWELAQVERMLLENDD